MDWIKKNKDWLITLAVFLFFAVLLSISSIFFKGNGKKDMPLPKIEEEARFELPSNPDAAAGDSTDGLQQPQTTSFFLRPSPSELLGKLEGLDYQQFKKETKNLPGLRIMWPAYFFSIIEVKDQKASIMLDSSEDGFGVILVTEIDIIDYPEILKLEKGKKIWLAAEITGVDPTGTGQFFLSTEYVRFDDYHHPASVEPALNEK